MATTAGDPAGVLEALESTDRILVQQLLKPVANEYRISVPSPGMTDEGRPLLFVKQKKLSVREDIRFRLAPDAGTHLFMIRAKTVFEFRGRHEVLDAEGQVIGLLEKDFAKSLVRSHWHVRDPAGTDFFDAHETSLPVALLRRFAGMASEWLAGLQWLPFNFELRRGDEVVGRYTRVLGPISDRYVLELADGLAGVDRRLLVAFAVALDALQDR